MTRKIQIEKIRNIGIIAHVDAGKTTLTERVMLFTGSIHAAGEVHEGTAQTDHHPLEQKKGITIMAAAVTCDHAGHRIHLIDTPGHVDFTIEVERSLRVLDGAVVVLDGVAGVEPQTETVWRQADRHRVPRLVLVNKLDRAGADFTRCVADVRDRLGARTVVVSFPIGREHGFTGVVDVVGMRALVWAGGDGTAYTVEAVPDELLENMKRFRDELVETCADYDAALFEHVIEGTEVSVDELRLALRRATSSGHVIPVLAASAYKNIGVQPMLDAVVDYLPSPRDRAPVEDVLSRAPRSADAEGPLAALAFKVTFDDFGQLTFVRVYSGTLRKGGSVLVPRTGRRLRVGRIVQLVAARRAEVDSLVAGEIGAVVGLPLAGGDTLSSEAEPCALESIVSPAPVVRLALEPLTRVDRDRLGPALARMLAADPSLRLESDPETGQILLAGMGQLHLDIAVERLDTDHGVRVRTGAPRVAYRCVPRASARHELRHVKQSGGPGQFAHVVLEVSPGSEGSGLVFEDLVKGGVIARELVPAVEKGVREAMSAGFLGDHPVFDVRVALLDGSMHPKDSNELAFKTAGAMAFKAAMLAADPVLLEPVVLLEVSCSEDAIGAVVGDVARRRGQVTDLGARGMERMVRAEVPLAETFGYSTALSALTHGRGRFSLEPLRYEALPERAREHSRSA